jgi:hypothetical protein
VQALQEGTNITQIFGVAVNVEQGVGCWEFVRDRAEIFSRSVTGNLENAEESW